MGGWCADHGVRRYRAVALRFYRYQEPLALSFLMAILAIVARQV
jgi:hypothetical protein